MCCSSLRSIYRKPHHFQVDLPVRWVLPRHLQFGTMIMAQFSADDLPWTWLIERKGSDRMREICSVGPEAEVAVPSPILLTGAKKRTFQKCSCPYN